MNTKSGFKKVYIIEQANSINQILEGNKKPFLVDLLKIEKSSIEDIQSLLSEETLTFSTAIGIVIQSNIQKIFLNTILNFKNSKNGCPIQVFSNCIEAESGLKSYA